MDLSRLGFVIENEWYWRITENARSFDASSAVRDFLAPLARHAKTRIALTEIAADPGVVRFLLAGEPVEITISSGLQDRVAINHFVGDLDRALTTAKTGLAFALVVPRRYELRGVLITDEELAQLAGNPALLVPSGRPSWRAIPAPTT
jgi:hypothetical protein